MTNDPVTHPEHYILPSGIELIDVIDGLPFCRGAAIKYLFRAGHKPGADEIEDLRKAMWMIGRELRRIGYGASEAELQSLDARAP